VEITVRRKKKVKSSLCLPKHCAMKTYAGMNVFSVTFNYECSLSSIKANKWLLHLQIFAITDMKENHLWKTSLRVMKHGFISSHQSQKEIPWLGNFLIHPITKNVQIEPSVEKTNNGDRVLKMWRPAAVWICLTKNDNQQWQILWNLKKYSKTIKQNETRMIKHWSATSHSTNLAP
jgi:hypothetical protein